MSRDSSYRPLGSGAWACPKFYGLPDEERSIATIHRAHAEHPITALQTEYSL